MRSAVIVCNGDFPEREYPRLLIQKADIIVCCDGAFATFLEKSPEIFGEERLPDAIIGDLDSIGEIYAGKYRDIIVHVPDQETNDQTKAFRYLIGRYNDIDEIHIVGATGKRADHTIGNLSLLMEYTKELDGTGISIDSISDFETAFAITDTSEIHCGSGRSISIFSPDPSLRIRSEGLVWPTDNVRFDNWWQATLNRSSEDTVLLELNHKSMVLITLD